MAPKCVPSATRINHSTAFQEMQDFLFILAVSTRGYLPRGKFRILPHPLPRRFTSSLPRQRRTEDEVNFG